MPGPLAPVQGPPVPGAPDEPVLDLREIQGNVLPGFNKDHQAFLFFQITKPETAKQWLRALEPRLATAAEVLAFVRLFRALRARRGEEGALAATWVNVAFTAEGLRKLAPPAEVDQFTDNAFLVGMAEQAGALGDPTNARGKPTGWVVGADDNYPDLLLIVASDTEACLRQEVARLKGEIEQTQGGPVTAAGQRGLRLLYEEEGTNLPGDLGGHEHFGFKDGISQPGVRGRASDAPLDFVTPRLIQPQDPLALTHSRPGQPLIWPGTFVLGKNYPLQDGQNAVRPLPAEPPQPDWAENGSFLVLRRLRQDVSAFWKFVTAEAKRLADTHPSLADLKPEHLASLLVGRWPSGAPVMRAPVQDDPDLGRNPTAANQFNFANPTVPAALIPDPRVAPDNFPPAPGDGDGLRCPLAGHIRKINPRDDAAELGGPSRVLPHRLLRRGIPFGKPLKNPLRPGGDRGNRGLFFLAYQSSIDNQFLFLTTDWANSPKNPRSYPGDHPGGHDPLIGQAPAAAGRQRTFTLRVDADTFETLVLPQDWVIPTGGGYFFAPSISAIRGVLAH
jgi:Dyp-type peroxidase family